MKNAKRKSIITAIILIITGTVVALSALTIIHFDFSKLSTEKTITESYEIKEEFQNINISALNCDVRFALSENEICTIEYTGNDKESVDVSAQNGTLTVICTEKRDWEDHIAIEIRRNDITVTLPQSEYSALSLKTKSGDIIVPDGFIFDEAMLESSSGNISFSSRAIKSLSAQNSSGDIYMNDIDTQSIKALSDSGNIRANSIKVSSSLSAQTSSGEISLQDVECTNAYVKSSSGEIIMSDAISTESINISSVSGDVKLFKCDAGKLSIETSSGNVFGTLLSEKIYITETSSGEINVPHTASGGICDVKTSSGNIEFYVIN